MKENKCLISTIRESEEFTDCEATYVVLSCAVVALIDVVVSAVEWRKTVHCNYSICI